MNNRDTSISPYKIMIVDDDPLVIKALERILFRQNYLFFSVNSGEEALTAIDEIEPDIILLDVFMKELTGFEVCKEFKKRGITERIPVIFLTSNNQHSEIVKGFQSGAVDYVIKPFNAEELLARLYTHLELKKAREEIRMINLQKTRFFSIMTHDINDALTGVRGVAGFLHQELLQNPVNIDEVKKLSQLLLDDSSDLYHFVRKLAKWNQLETGAEPVKNISFKLHAIIAGAIEKLSTMAKTKNVSLNVVGGQEIEIFSDQKKLTDIIEEVLSNAIKYSHKGGAVQILMAKSHNKTTLQVIDHGIGMDREVIENIFRLDTPHPKTIGTMNERGIGMGLIISNAQAALINVKMEIASEKHQGLTVTLTIPDNF
jgi:two-component system, sensor histidine kinase and response regulator